MVVNSASEDIVALIKERSDIVQIIGEAVDLKRSGVRYLGRCPFHSEKTPSFSVHPGQQFYHCFGCGESGDVFSFFMKYHNLDFPSALKELARRCHVEVPIQHQSKKEVERKQKSEQLFAINEKSAQLFAHCLQETPAGHIAREYLKKRGISKQLQTEFKLGYAPAAEDAGWNFLGNQLEQKEKQLALEVGLLVAKEAGRTYDRFRDRILFPIMDISGRICGFGGRIIGDGQPKYLNSPESLVFNKGKLLLGLFHQKEFIRQQNHAVIVEGNFDMLSLVAHGCNNVVAPLGTALTRDQLRLLKRFADKVTLLFDGDAAGNKAALRAVPLFLAEQIPGRVAFLPEGHDPDTFVRERGSLEIARLLENSVDLPEFAFNKLVAQYGLTLDGKSKILEELKPMVAAAASSLQRSLFIAHFAERLGIEAKQFEAGLASQQKNSPPLQEVQEEKKHQGPFLELSRAQRQLVEFMVLNPYCFQKMAEAGLRGCLTDSIGEVLYLQIEELLHKRPAAEPEELLATLPEGPERSLVADLLLRPNISNNSEDENRLGDHIEEVLLFIRKFQFKKRAEQLMIAIIHAEKAGEHQRLQDLLVEQASVAKQMHNLPG